MTDPFAKHILASIRNELAILKEHNYIEGYAYDDILRLLPTNIGTRGVSAGGYPPAPSSQYNNSGPPTSMPGGPMGSPLGVGAGGPPPPPSYNAVANKSLGSAEALYDYNGNNPATDLNLVRGEIVQIVEYVNDDWWKGTVNGRTGIFPSSYVKKLNNGTPRQEKMPPPPPARQSERDSYGGYSPAPPKQDNAYQYPPPPSQQNSYNSAPATYTPPAQYQPPAAQYQPPPQQHVSYAAPLPAVAQSSSSAPPPAEEHESKASGFGKKLAGNVANAATWGFGATLGSDLANKIF